MRKKQYASMQEELAARKAAAGLTEEPRAVRGSAEEDGAGWTDRLRGSLRRNGEKGAGPSVRGKAAREIARADRAVREAREDGGERPGRANGIRVWLLLAFILFFIGIMVSVFLINDEPGPGSDSPFTEDSTDEEIAEYVAERWSVDPDDTSLASRLELWADWELEILEFRDIGDWRVDLSGNMATIRTERPEGANEDEFEWDCIDACDQVDESLAGAGMEDEPAVLVAREAGTGKLLLVLINGYGYYP